MRRVFFKFRPFFFLEKKRREIQRAKNSNFFPPKISKKKKKNHSHATYDGVDMHPFETLFVKSSWHVGEPFVSAYSRWGARLAASSKEEDGDSGDKDKDNDGDSDGDGETFSSSSSSFDAGTGGTFDEPRYRYAISPEAQEDWGVSECFGKGAPPLPEWRKNGKKKGKVDDGSWSEWWLQS